MIAIAGPIANLILAILFAIILKLVVLYYFSDSDDIYEDLNTVFILRILTSCVFLNYGLFIFNMIPIPPLDGSHLILKSINISRETEAKIIKYGAIGLLAIIIIDTQTHLNILPIGSLIRYMTIHTFYLLHI